MTWTLVDVNTPVIQELDGVKVHIKPMTNGEKFRTAKAIEAAKDKDLDTVLEAVAPFVLEIEGHPKDDIAGLLKRIADPKLQGGIISAVLAVSTLSEEQQKNLSSSSAT